MYADVTVVVEGAVEEDRRFFDSALLQEFIEELRREQQDSGYNFAIVLEHDHDPTADCSCVEYLQDHRPTYEFTTPRSQHAYR